MNKNTFVVGFMLFAIFFGAGNLIFPPKLGADSGVDFWPSILGFVVTGVGLPLLGIAVGSFYKGGYKEILKRIHPAFALCLLLAIFLALGPFFGGPRTAATAYSIAMVPFLDHPNATAQFIFCLIYFLISLWLSLNPAQMVDRVGEILTPALLIGLIALIVKSYFLFNAYPAIPVEHPIPAPFVNGMVEGYSTLDALASVVFAVVVLTAIKEKSPKGTSIPKQTVYAGIIASVFLTIIYIALGWLGNRLPVEINEHQSIGPQILNTAAVLAYGEFGRVLLGIIVTLACLTTTIGIGTASSEYFHEIFPRISYKTYVVLFTIVSFIIANIGLKAVIDKSLPVLLILYPITMTVIVLLLINLFVKLPLASHRFAAGLVTIESFCIVLGKSHLTWLSSLPIREDMVWIFFAFAGVILGYIWQAFSKKKEVLVGVPD